MTDMLESWWLMAAGGEKTPGSGIETECVASSSCVCVGVYIQCFMFWVCIDM